jgi:hypothetical protein
VNIPSKFISEILSLQFKLTQDFSDEELLKVISDARSDSPEAFDVTQSALAKTFDAVLDDIGASSDVKSYVENALHAVLNGKAPAKQDSAIAAEIGRLGSFKNIKIGGARLESVVAEFRTNDPVSASLVGATLMGIAVGLLKKFEASEDLTNYASGLIQGLFAPTAKA